MQAELAVKLSKVQKEKDFLQQTSDSLLRNQDDFRTQLVAEQTRVKAKDAQITDLTEQVCTSSYQQLLKTCIVWHVESWQCILHGIHYSVKNM